MKVDENNNNVDNENEDSSSSVFDLLLYKPKFRKNINGKKGLDKIVDFFKNLSPTMKMVILSMAYFILAVGILFIIIIIIIAPLSLASDDNLSGEGPSSSLVDNNYHSDKILAEKRQKEFDQELKRVVKMYKDNYGITLSGELIVSTLTESFPLGESMEDNGCNGSTDPNCDKEDLKEAVKQDDFYKKAKAHIKTLAKYMVIEVKSINECTDSESYMVTIPDNPKDIANNYTTWDQSFGFASKQTITNYIKKDSQGYCPSKDIRPTKISEYRNSPEKKELVEKGKAVQRICKLKPNSIECAKSEQNYAKLVDKLYTNKWALKSITDSDLSSLNSKIEFSCPYKQVKADVNSGIIQVEYENGDQGCSEIPKSITRYRVDDAEKGVYYYKLMANFKNAFGLSSEDSFISKYYGSYVKDNTGNILDTEVVKAVDRIYSLYAMKHPGGLYGGATGPFTEWLQFDPIWGSISLGNSNIANIGCAATATAIQLARSGVMTTIPNLNPGTFVESMKAAGGFDSIGNIQWGRVTTLAPNFIFIARNAFPSGQSNAAAEAARLLQQGLYLVVQVKRPEEGTHFVAIDRVDGNSVYMFDPSSKATDLFAKYSGMYFYVAYAKVG